MHDAVESWMVRRAPSVSKPQTENGSEQGKKCNWIPAAGPVTRLEGLLPSFADVVSEFGDALFLLFQGIQDNAHWRLLQTYSLHFIFQLVLEVSKSQGCVDEHH